MNLQITSGKSDLPIANLHAQFWLRMQFAFDSSGPGGPILRQLQMHNGNVFEFRPENYGFALRHENFHWYSQERTTQNGVNGKDRSRLTQRFRY